MGPSGVGLRLVPMTEFVRVGETPRPSNAQELERRVRDAILEQLGADPGTTVRGAEHLSVHAELEGTNIVVIKVDASLVEIDAETESNESTPRQEITPAGGAEVDEESSKATHRETGMLRHGAFTAVPLRFQGVPAAIEVTAANVPFEWLELDDGGLALGMPDHMSTTVRGAARLHLRVSADPDDLLTAIMRVLRLELAEGGGIHVDREKLTLKQLGPRRVRVGLSARLRWKLMRPTLHARTELHIDTQYVARLRRTRLTSTNVVVAVVLRVMRPRINRELSKPLDLRESLSFLTLRRLRVEAGSNRVMLEIDAGFA